MGMDYNKLKFLTLGQVLSICITCTNLSVTKLSQLGVKLPLSLNLLTYTSLTLIFFIKLSRTNFSKSVLNWCWDNKWFGIILALIDVEANYLVIKGFSYTSLLSAVLIGAWSTPCVVLLSYLLLGKRYLVNHLIGISLALLGLILLIFSDYYVQPNWWESDTFFGDMCCLLGATLYALSNIIQEKFIQTWSPSEFLFILGMFGTIITSIQWYFVELDLFRSTQFTWLNTNLMLLCTAGLVIFYSLTPILISSTSAAFFNISLLTSDFWSLLVGLILFELNVPEVYPISFILVIYGLYLFNTTSSQVIEVEWYSWTQVNPSLNSTESRHFNYEVIP